MQSMVEETLPLKPLLSFDIVRIIIELRRNEKVWGSFLVHKLKPVY